MQKLLYVTAFPPNHKSGGQTFSYNAIKDLAHKYSIDLIYFDYANHEIEVSEYVNEIKHYKPSIMNAMCRPYFFPIFSKRYNTRIKESIQKIADNYDVLYFDYSQVAIYSLFICHKKKIIRCHDVMVQKFLRKNRFIAKWVEKNEYRILKSANQIFVPSQKDQEIIRRKYNLFSEYTNEYIADYSLKEDISMNGKYIFFGLWSRKENLDGLNWFLDNVYLQLEENVKKNLIIMGGGMRDEYKKILKNKFEIDCLGYVDDCYTVISQCKAMIVPLFSGAGVKIKVLDSFITGTPVIGTDIAFEGIPKINGLTYKAETVQEFVEIINGIHQLDVKEKKKLGLEFKNNYNCRHLADFI